MHKNTRKRAAAVATGAALALVAGGVAYGYWTTGGAGTGSASTGDVTAITINTTSTQEGLYPGGAPVAISGDFTNLNKSAVYVTAMQLKVESVSNPACSASDFTVTNPTTFDNKIPSGTHVGSWSGATIKLENLDKNQDACKNVTVNLALTSS